MPVLTQLNLNIGTEQNPNMVLHDLHDIRISSTDVNTVTRLLGCDAGVNSIAPLTLANAASLLGVLGGKFKAQSYAGDGISNGMPADYGLLIEAQGSYYWCQIFISKISDVVGGLYTRISVYGGASYTSWKEI